MLKKLKVECPTHRDNKFTHLYTKFTLLEDNRPQSKIYNLDIRNPQYPQVPKINNIKNGVTPSKYEKLIPCNTNSHIFTKQATQPLIMVQIFRTA